MTLALASCRANPGFILFEDDGEDRDGESESEGASDSTADSAGESTGTADICEPKVVEPGEACRPWKALPLWVLDGFNVADSPPLENLPCKQVTQLLVKRDGNALQQCDAGCDQPCEGPSINVGFAAGVADIGPLLPVEGECAVLWHRGKDNPDPESDVACLTAGFALFDDEPEQRLRVAVAFNTPDPDPFAGVPGSPFAVTVTGEAVGDGFCLGMEQTQCDAMGAIPKLLDFRFGECSVRTSQGQIVSELLVGGERHILENHSAYDCISTGPTVYRWWLRRVF